MNKFAYLYNEQYSNACNFTTIEQRMNTILHNPNINVIEINYKPIVFNDKLYAHALIIYEAERQLSDDEMTHY
ncbi:MAG: hypothetical protein RSE41_01045 [Clostridia bacterium]